MADLTLTFTSAGIAEVINAENTGTAPVEITEIGVGTGQYTPSESQTALQNEVKRLSTIAGDAVGDDKIHVSVTDESSDTYQMYEFGLYLQSGTLLAVYSQSGTPILDKTADTILLLAFDCLITQFQATSLTFGNTDFMNPPATTTSKGVVELATNTETQAGTDTERAITPAALASLTSSPTRRGLVELATDTETQAGTDAGRAVTPAGLASLTASQARRGLIEIATQAETDAGNDDVRAITAKKLGAFLSSFYKYATEEEALEGTSTGRVMSPARVFQAFQQFGLGFDSLVEFPSSDLNNSVATGFYRVSNGQANRPTSSDEWALFNFRQGTHGFQIANARTSGATTFTRTRTTGGWTDWAQLFSTSDIATQSEAEAGVSSDKVMTPLNVHQAFNQYGFGVDDPPNPTNKDLNNQQVNTINYTINGLNIPPEASRTSAGTFFWGNDSYGTQIWGRDSEVFFRTIEGGIWQPWKELYHTGNVEKVADKDYRSAQVGSGITLQAHQTYHIATDNTYTLPAVAGLTGGDTVVLTKSIFNTPTIQVNGGGGENIRVGRSNGTTAADTSILFDINSEIIFVWNGTSWEV